MRYNGEIQGNSPHTLEGIDPGAVDAVLHDLDDPLVEHRIFEKHIGSNAELAQELIVTANRSSDPRLFWRALDLGLELPERRRQGTQLDSLVNGISEETSPKPRSRLSLKLGGMAAFLFFNSLRKRKITKPADIL